MCISHGVDNIGCICNTNVWFLGTGRRNVQSKYSRRGGGDFEPTTKPRTPVTPAREKFSRLKDFIDSENSDSDWIDTNILGRKIRSQSDWSIKIINYRECPVITDGYAEAGNSIKFLITCPQDQLNNIFGWPYWWFTWPSLENVYIIFNIMCHISSNKCARCRGRKRTLSLVWFLWKSQYRPPWYLDFNKSRGCIYSSRRIYSAKYGIYVRKWGCPPDKQLPGSAIWMVASVYHIDTNCSRSSTTDSPQKCLPNAVWWSNCDAEMVFSLSSVYFKLIVAPGTVKPPLNEHHREWKKMFA